MKRIVIVVVNHDPLFLKMMQALLIGAAYEPICLLASDNVFVQVREAQPALMVLDIDIHHRDASWTLVERVHRDSATARIPVIICTGDIAFTRAKIADIRMYHYAVVNKPFEPDDLLGMIREMTASSP